MEMVRWPNSFAGPCRADVPARAFFPLPFPSFFVCLFNDSGPLTAGDFDPCVHCSKAHVPNAVQGRELALPSQGHMLTERISAKMASQGPLRLTC